MTQLQSEIELFARSIILSQMHQNIAVSESEMADPFRPRVELLARIEQLPQRFVCPRVVFERFINGEDVSSSLACCGAVAERFAVIGAIIEMIGQLPGHSIELALVQALQFVANLRVEPAAT